MYDVGGVVSREDVLSICLMARRVWQYVVFMRIVHLNARDFHKLPLY